ncbi:MAG TPA: class I SAM-dependent methyltransferase [Candidatus Paceibacterota bacterium]
MNTLDYIKTKQQTWFKHIQPYLSATNLNVGSGHGFFSQAAQDAGISMTSLEVCLPENVINKNDVVLYDGIRMPFDDNAFDVSIAMYVLHHTSDPVRVLNEMKRVSKKRIILVEQLYTNFFGKIYLAIDDWLVNIRGGLRSSFYWHSYLTYNRLRDISQEGGWKIYHTESKSRTGFNDVLWILERI